jgi:iron complex outermembrane receptor protein
MITRSGGARLRSLLFFSAAAMALAAHPAAAQTAAPAPAVTTTADGSAITDEIVVTARRREERLQDVPLAISAYSEQRLAAQGIKSLADLAAATPGLAFQDLNGAYAAPVLRGIAQIDQTGPQGNVGVFIDGVYLNNRSALAFDQYDISRIEVVKGPQSALYGRNTFAGAINYVTVDPSTAEFGGKVQGTIGNYGRHEAKGAVNLPLGPNAAMRVFGGYSEFGGTIRNARSGKRLDGWDDRWSAGASFTANLTDNLTLHLFGVHSSTRNDQPALFAIPTTQNNCGATTVVGGRPLNTFFCGTLPYPDTVDLNDTVGYGLRGHSNIVYGRLTYEGDGVKVTGLGSYTNASYGMLFDTSGDPTAVNTPLFGGLSRQLYTNSVTSGSRDYNVDVRAESTGDHRLSWMIGVNAYDSAVSDILALEFQLLGQPNSIPPVFSSRSGRLRTKGKAIYGSLGYKVTDKLNVQAEVRYAVDDQDFTGSGAAAGVKGSQTLKYATPRVSLNYQPSRDLLVYATAARGVKNGGFNSNAVGTPFFSFGPEKNWTYEFGVKSTLLDGALVANADVFYVDWKAIHAQTQLPFSTLSVVANNGDARVKGIEGQVVYNVTRNLTLEASGALLDPKYKNNVKDGEVAYICGEIAGSTVLTSNCTSFVGGNQIARTSDKQYALSANWNIPEIFTGTDAFVRADYSWQAGKYSTSLNLQNQGSIKLLNARAGLRWKGAEIALWAKNLLQEKYVSRATVVASTADSGPLSGVSYTRVYPGERRTFGVDVSYRF